MAMDDGQPGSPIVEERELRTPGAPKKKKCCNACHLCQQQEQIPRLENEKCDTKECPVCKMKRCTTCGLVISHDSNRNCRIANVCTGPTAWKENDYCMMGCNYGDPKCCHPHLECYGCSEGLGNQMACDCLKVKDELELEFFDKPRCLNFDVALVPESPPRQPSPDITLDPPQDYIPETPPRKRRPSSPSMFDSDRPPTGRARSEPPSFKYNV